jgi:L-alanine-DL-glutamate epimerase-like enolase superfamily enzyme
MCVGLRRRLDVADRLTLRVVSARFYERPVRLRIPFRFGVVTLREAQQVFVQAGIRLADGRESSGQAAELLAPKWFDKNPALSNEENADQLRSSLAVARALYLAGEDDETAFGLHATRSRSHHAQCDSRGLNGLIAGFGTALIDRAVLDALCRILGLSIFALVKRNLPGIDAATAPDLAGFDLDAFCASLRPAAEIDARHTVGLIDAITEVDIPREARVDDGLPESLEAVIEKYGHRYFKIKVAGDLDADIDRLSRVASVLDRLDAPYFVSLDGNEQYAHADAALELIQLMAETPRLDRLLESILYVEQPVARANALQRPIRALAANCPVAVDESDADIGVFPCARALGYRGISSKSCKGFYRSILNAARAEAWNAEEPGAGYFITAEDLTTQAGVSVQQDFALATLVQCTHVERNGHHYVDGMEGVSEDEQRRFLAAHPDLYEASSGRVRLVIRDGRVAIGSLAQPGLGAAPEPEWAAMSEVSHKYKS